MRGLTEARARVQQALLLAALAAAAATAPPGSAARPELRFREDGTFSIAQFTDCHYGQGADHDRRTDQVQAAVLAADQPDLVAFTGDQVSGFAWDGSPGWYERRWRQLLRPSLAAGVPHASVLGNHDGEAGLSRRGILDLDRRLGGNLTLSQAGPRYLPGAGNYWLDVHDAAGADVAARLWFLDSGSMGCEDLAGGWGCVPSATVAWLEEHGAALPPVPSLAFIHIPLPQFREAWNSQPTWGAKGEDVACPLRDTGVYDALRRLGVQAVYSGHDHSSDFHGTLGGVRLAYGRKTGYGNYGPAGAKGARIIRLRVGQSAAVSDTWIRAEDGSMEEQATAVLPADKRAQAACSANGWLWQRLHDPRTLSSLLYLCLGALAVMATTAAGTVAVGRCLQRRRKMAERYCGSDEEELAFLGTPVATPPASFIVQPCAPGSAAFLRSPGPTAALMA